ncbi:MAG TPA: ferredoxin--NADP reductase, partial [Mycobacterium sp.]
ELLSPMVIGDDHTRCGWFRRLVVRLRLKGRDGTPAGTAIDLQDVKVVDVIRETASATALVLEDTSGSTFDFKAGQFFTISARVGKSTIRRAYSASCAPGGRRCAVTIKQVTDGSMSTYLNTKVKPGDRLQIMGPSGSFCIPSPSSVPKELVLIAVGSGITPIMSILRTMMTETKECRVALIYGNRTEEDIIFAAALAELCATYPDRLVVRHVLTKPSPTWTGATGRLDHVGLRRQLSDLATGPGSHYYICGPEGVMEGARNALVEDGIEESRIHRERFVRAVDDLDAGSLAPQTMVVDSDGTQLASLTVRAGDSLLQTGLAARLSMPYSCTVGNCGDCMVKLLEGEVSMGEPNCLEPEQRSNGYILACIAKPRSAVRIEIIDV